MRKRLSRSGSVERRVVLDALARIVSRFDTDVLIAALPLLTELALDPRLPITPGLLHRFEEKLRLVRRYGRLRSRVPRKQAADDEIGRRVCRQVKSADPDVRVSPRSLRRWFKDWNAPGPDGLAVGAAALLDRYKAYSEK